ncbi:MAG: His-Xaa-Ser system radical SAM maturase HxsC [Rikenellaceae bacterium]
MKQINSIVTNIEDEVLGIITLKPKNIFGRNKYILVSENLDTPKRGYAATISNRKLSGSTNRSFCMVSELSDFKDGDVVLINSSGEIIFLYDIRSSHNAIMATELCNHRCVMCPQPPIVKEKDKTDFNLKLISLFDKSTQEVGITGGEPTLIGDKLFILIKHIQKHLPHSAISILSNGVKFADKGYAKKLAILHHYDLQIDVPLFSDIASEHNKIVGANTFYKTVDGLYNLAQFRQRIGIRVVIHKLNYKRLPQLAEYIYHNFPFICQVAFMQIETLGLAQDNIDKLWIDPYDYNRELEQAVLILRDRGITTHIYNAQLCILPRSIRPFAQQSISDWKNIYIDKCERCALMSSCAGFFASNKDRHSEHIKNISQNDICN